MSRSFQHEAHKPECTVLAKPHYSSVFRLAVSRLAVTVLSEGSVKAGAVPNEYSVALFCVGLWSQFVTIRLGVEEPQISAHA